MPVLTEYAQTLRQKAVFANKKIILKKNSSFDHRTLSKNCLADTLRGSAAAVAATWKTQ
jgi:hypothetical protein